MVDNKREIELRPMSVERPELPVKPEGNLEVEGWMEKIEKKFARIPNDTTNVSDDKVVIQSPTVTDQPPVTLPVTQQQMVVGKKAKTDLGIAWLVAWVIRQIKMFAKSGRRVRLQDLPEVKE